VTKRLSQIFETDTVRAKQAYFAVWYEIFRASFSVIQRVQDYQNSPFRVRLDNAWDRCNRDLQVAERRIRELERGLHNLSAMVRRLEVLAHGALPNLADHSTQEGTLMRRWMATFAEMEATGYTQRRLMTEPLVRTWLAQGVEREPFWSDDELERENDRMRRRRG
jgi:hypothetical protein